MCFEQNVLFDFAESGCVILILYRRLKYIFSLIKLSVDLKMKMETIS